MNAIQLQSVVYTDDLTGLPNYEQMIKMIGGRIKNQDAFFLATFDVKNFKIINDLWGYETVSYTHLTLPTMAVV